MTIKNMSFGKLLIAYSKKLLFEKPRIAEAFPEILLILELDKRGETDGI